MRALIPSAAILVMLGGCQPATLDEAATQRAIEIVEASIPGVDDVALTDVIITASEANDLQVCATASAANLPPRKVIALVLRNELMPDPLMNLMEVTGGFDSDCGPDARRRVFEASDEQTQRWMEQL